MVRCIHGPARRRDGKDLVGLPAVARGAVRGHRIPVRSPDGAIPVRWWTGRRRSRLRGGAERIESRHVDDALRPGGAPAPSGLAAGVRVPRCGRGCRRTRETDARRRSMHSARPWVARQIGGGRIRKAFAALPTYRSRTRFINRKFLPLSAKGAVRTLGTDSAFATSMPLNISRSPEERRHAHSSENSGSPRWTAPQLFALNDK